MPCLGGCDFADALSSPAYASSVFWRGDCHANILPVEAFPAGFVGDADSFDLLSVPHPVTVLRSLDGEHVLICDGPRSLRLDVIAGSLLSGPVRLGYCLSGFAGVEAKVMTLRRLLALERLGRLPSALFRPERKARRWGMVLQAYDGMRAGASQREIATILYGEERVRADWEAGYLRTRVQRLIRTAEKMIVGGGYRVLLQ
ncbi:DUF2285 domain-containing protein [Chelativorans intermedius]|uniref:DUF2285 domain-containing protein n=1 Tax=Chelativorans intermedius TaxID=515947 RepID=A0ABV6DAT5_9HYPH|nr:DUF2285 domain-containing protein [Chelativorans intermedius]MCT9000177.1 DUF2285 domain-containing protein [Chelativorans intermedius]